MGKEAEEGDSIQAVIFLTVFWEFVLGFFLRVLPDPYKCEH